MAEKWAFISDHGGVAFRQALMPVALELGIEVIDLGVEDSNTRVDFPNQADEACKVLLSGTADRAVLVCKTGIGMSIRANRHKKIHAAVIHDPITAVRSKEHNNANVLCFGADVTTEAQAEVYLKMFYEAEFLGGRYQQRIDMVDQ